MVGDIVSGGLTGGDVELGNNLLINVIQRLDQGSQTVTMGSNLPQQTHTMLRFQKHNQTMAHLPVLFGSTTTTTTRTTVLTKMFFPDLISGAIWLDQKGMTRVRVVAKDSERGS